MDGDMLKETKAGIGNAVATVPVILPPDPTQSINLVADEYLRNNPGQRAALEQKLELMKNMWFAQAGMYNGLPLDDRSTAEVLGTERPQLTPDPFPDKPNGDPADSTDTYDYTYYPGGSEIPEAVAPNIRTRSYSIEATVDFSGERTPQGVLLAHGGRFGGHSFYIHEDRLCYVYNWLGKTQQKISCPLGTLSGEVPLKVEFTKEETLNPNDDGANKELGSSTVGTVRLSIDGNPQDSTIGIKGDFVYEYKGKFLTQPAKFALCGEGFNIGRDGGQPVSQDYASPGEFEGATIKQVVVTIKNDAGASNTEKEFAGMLWRD